MELESVYVRMNFHPKGEPTWKEQRHHRWINIEEAKKFFLAFIKERNEEGATFYFYLFDESRKNWEDGWEEYGIKFDDEEVLWLDERLK